MQVSGCKDQGDWYVQNYTNIGGQVGRAMLELIERLREVPDNRLVYLLTSVSTLCLMSQDSYEPSGWHVRIEPPWEGTYTIEYEPPGQETLRLLATTPDEALELTLVAMRASGAWS